MLRLSSEFISEARNLRKIKIKNERRYRKIFIRVSL